MSKSRLYLLSLSGKNTITFCNNWAIFVRKQGEVTSQRARIKVWQNLLNPLNSCQLPVKIFWFQHFPVLRLIDHKGHFRKILTQILTFGCFSWYHTYTFEKNELNFLMQNLMLNWLAPFSNPKNENGKGLYVLFWDQFN